MFIYSGSARLISFEIRLISKETSRDEREYMNMYPFNERSRFTTVQVYDKIECLQPEGYFLRF